MLWQAGMKWLLVEPHRQVVELHRSTEEGEVMNTSDRGLKHVCPECETKYYDLRKAVVACPRCGAKPLAAKARKTTQPARKAGGTRFGRYPY
jgi:ssDNA-binding Zn-finger/Zn-ribbon topoisomerase 1